MSPRVRRHLRELLAIGAFVAIAAVVAVYILDHQRLRWPWEETTRIEAAFSNAQAVTPGQGQTVTVAGVNVGEVADVRLEDGRAIVTLELDSPDLGPVYRNATMLLRPKTGLNDMSVQLDPGTPDPELPDRGRLREGDRLPAAATLPHVNPDEVLAALDADTRRYVAVLVNASGDGLAGRGRALRAFLRAGRPPLEKTARIAQALRDRRAELRRLVTSLRRLAGAARASDEDLAELVESSAQVLATLGDRERELSVSVAGLPGALAATTGALRETRALAADAGPALDALVPVAERLGPALDRLEPLLRDAEPILRDELRPLVRDATPLAEQLRPSLAGLERSGADLVRVGEIANYLVNELGYNPPGPEEGFLFWTAWLFHNANDILTVEDAHGTTWRGLAMAGCSTIGQNQAENPLLEPLEDLAICTEEPPTTPSRAGRRR
jgi:phospholipid/cholesterol/gamma-HCH transport system substrate-binding protein